MRLALLLALPLALAGCSAAADSAAPEVASLSAPPSRTAVAAAPVIRPDTTFEEQARMGQPWMRCLRDNGIPMRTTEAGLLDIDATGNAKGTNGRIMAADPKIVAVCGKLQPVLAPELDEEKNPYWADDDENYHKCLVAHGSKLVKKDGKWMPGPGWNDQAPDEARDLACQAEAYDGKRG